MHERPAKAESPLRGGSSEAESFSTALTDCQAGEKNAGSLDRDFGRWGFESGRTKKMLWGQIRGDEDAHVDGAPATGFVVAGACGESGDATDSQPH